MRSSFGFLTLLFMLMASELAQADTIADSVADFSGVQGQNNWYYGYVAPATSDSFVEMPNFGSPNAGLTNTWFIDAAPPGIVPPHVFTVLYATGGAPNGLITSGGDPVEEWADRRWVSTVEGSIQINGLLGDEAVLGDESSGSFGTGNIDGIVGQILVDGVPVWSTTTDGFTHSAPYSVSATVALGSTVDFIIQPRANDYSDSSTFTAQIETVTPLPPSFLGGVVLLAGLALTGAVRRRHSMAI